jgi:hypothetical protein
LIFLSFAKFKKSDRLKKISGRIERVSRLFGG